MPGGLGGSDLTELLAGRVLTSAYRHSVGPIEATGNFVRALKGAKYSARCACLN